LSRHGHDAEDAQTHGDPARPGRDRHVLRARAERKREEMKLGPAARTVLRCCLALAVFSAAYSAAAWYDWWPRLRPGALHDTDLWAGIAAGVALLLVLLLRRGEDNEGSGNRAVGEGLAPPAPTS